MDVWMDGQNARDRWSGMGRYGLAEKVGFVGFN